MFWEFPLLRILFLKPTPIFFLFFVARRRHREISHTAETCARARARPRGHDLTVNTHAALNLGATSVYLRVPLAGGAKYAVVFYIRRCSQHVGAYGGSGGRRHILVNLWDTYAKRPPKIRVRLRFSAASPLRYHGLVFLHGMVSALAWPRGMGQKCQPKTRAIRRPSLLCGHFGHPKFKRVKLTFLRGSMRVW